MTTPAAHQVSMAPGPAMGTRMIPHPNSNLNYNHNHNHNYNPNPIYNPNPNLPMITPAAHQ
eukprot:5522536-Pyramimonas_sp.AAC.1